MVPPRILSLIGWLVAVAIGAAISLSTAIAQEEPASWRQRIQQGPKGGIALEAAGDTAADAGKFPEAASHYEPWRELPSASPEQKALAMIKLGQLAEAQFETAQAREWYEKALPLVPPNGSIAHEIRLRIEDSYRRLGDIPGLVADWQKYLDAHGGTPEINGLLSSAQAELRHPEGDAPVPSKPSATTSPTLDPHLLDSLRACRLSANIHKINEERELLAAAFNAQTDPLLRLEMVGALANAFASSGRLDELLADFRAKCRAENDGWRYAVYLAEIQRNLHDILRADSELARAFGPRSRDVLFLTERWRVSVDQQGTGERARLARLLAQVDPRPSREIELVSALLRNGETTSALKELQANATAISEDPMKWHDVLLQAGAAGQGQTVATLLEAGLAQHSDDWRWRFLLAEARLRTGDFAIAEKLLHEIESTPAAASTPPAAKDGNDPDESTLFSYVNGLAYASGTAQGPALAFARRNGQGAQIRQIMQQIAAGLNGVSAIAGQQFIFSGYLDYQPQRYLPRTPAEAADAALVMQSILAHQEGRGADFVAGLRESLAKLPRAQRIARLALVQALDPLLQELTAESATPSGDDAVNAIGLEVLLDLASEISPRLGRVDVDRTVLISLLSAFLSREKHPETLLLGKMQLSRLERRAGREKEAAEVAREILGEWATVSKQHRYEIFEFALENGDLEHAEAIVTAMKDSNATSQQIKLATAFAGQKAGDARAVKWLAEAIRASYDFGSPNLSHLYSVRARSAFHQAQEFPYGCRIIGEGRLTIWNEAFSVASQHGLVAALKAAIAEPAKTLPPAASLSAHLAGIYFSWSADDRDSAIREILEIAASHHDDEIDLLAGSMLAAAGRPAEARKLWEQISPSNDEIAIDKTVRLLELARAEKDTDRARTLALQLAALPVSASDQSVLQGTLTELELQGHATELRDKVRAREEGAFFSGMQGAVQQLQRETQAGDQSKAVELARAILARVSPLANSTTDRYPRRMAIDTLVRWKTLGDYTSDLVGQLAVDPKSMETILRLAEAFERADPAHSAEFYRRAVELSPDDLTLQIRLGDVLANSRKADEAVEIWKAAFVRDPQLIFGAEFATFFSGFKTASQLDELAAILLKAAPLNNPLQNLAFFMPDTSYCYQQVAAALIDTGKPVAAKRGGEKIPSETPEPAKLAGAIELWKASLARARAGRSPEYVEASTLQTLVPALLEAGRKEEAAQELEDYFFPPAPPRPALGFAVRSTERDWAKINFGSGGREEPLGIAVMRLGEGAGALDRLRAKAAAWTAAHPQDPERFLVLLVDSLRRDPKQLETLQREYDAVIDAAIASAGSAAPHRVEAAGVGGVVNLPAPWEPQTGSLLRACAQVLAEWPEGRPLAVHVLEKTPDTRAVHPGWIKLHRAQIALQIPDKEAAIRALREWLAWSERTHPLLSQTDAAEQLTAVDLMIQAGMREEASTVLKSVQSSAGLLNRSDLKKQADDLARRLTANGN